MRDVLHQVLASCYFPHLVPGQVLKKSFALIKFKSDLHARVSCSRQNKEQIHRFPGRLSLIDLNQNLSWCLGWIFHKYFVRSYWTTQIFILSSTRGPDFCVDKSIVIPKAIAPIKTEMHHGMTVIVPIRCKRKSAQPSTLDDWVDFMPVNTPHHRCSLGWDICYRVPHFDVIFILMAHKMLLFQNVTKMWIS